MDGWMVHMLFKCVHWCRFFSYKHGFLGLTSLSSDTTALRKSYLKLGLQIVR